MKAKLFLAASLFAVVANAQVSTINENFNAFTAGNTTFPQNGWSAIIAANPLPFPPAPMMLVTNAADKAVQAYSGNNTSAPSYLIAPQIVAPAGDKVLTFDASKAVGSGGNGSLEVGLASSPNNMTTFVSLRTVTLSSETVQTISVPVSASTNSYIVFKFTPTVAHTALQIDNVKYDTNLAVSENGFSANDAKFAVTADNHFLKFASNNTLESAKIYSAAGQLAAEGKINNDSFDITRLKTGVYFIIIENKKGQTVKSKFIKK